ncbi:uncharacterized protein LOC128852993 isoform X2 [Cuculus canorus]|uniref:uncharacterized protein LOC128852993 isoform X2 n=1 Tax=Cuculus canorus TaxID=55661 RepID=UPI0023AB2BBB|nr:uncharacterized protein LOC128852993 isoform X2 [Cuculus canorus]
MLIPSTWVVVEWEASFKEPWATSGPENENKITCRTKSKPDAEGRMEEILIWKLNVVCNQRIQVFGLKFSWFWRCYPNPRESHICTNTSNSISSICLSKMEVKTSTASEVNLESAAERDLLVVLLYATLLCHHWCCLRECCSCCDWLQGCAFHIASSPGAFLQKEKAERDQNKQKEICLRAPGTACALKDGRGEQPGAFPSHSPQERAGDSSCSCKRCCVFSPSPGEPGPFPVDKTTLKTPRSISGSLICLPFLGRSSSSSATISFGTQRSSQPMQPVQLRGWQALLSGSVSYCDRCMGQDGSMECWHL